MRQLLFLFVVACGSSSSQAVPATPVTPEGGHRVVFERPLVIGQQYRASATTHSRQAQSFQPDGAPPAQPQLDEKVVSMVGVIERTGELTFRVNIEAFQVVRGGETLTPLPSGATIDVTRGEPSQILVDGEPATGDLADWIGLVVPDGPPRDEDQMYGTGDLQPIGGTWQFRHEVVAELLQRMRVEAPAEAIEGGFEVVEATTDPEGIRVRGNLAIDQLNFPHLENAEVESGQVRLDMEWVLPTDPQAHSPSRSMHLLLNATMRISDPETGESGLLMMGFENQREVSLALI